jgi:phosphate transport system permease protein
MSERETAQGLRDRWRSGDVRARAQRRHRADRRFRLAGLAAIVTAGGALAALLCSIAWNGYGAFLETRIRLDVRFDAELLGIAGVAAPERERALARADYGALVRDALARALGATVDPREMRRLQALVSSGARTELQQRLLADPALLGRSESLWLVADDEVDMIAKGRTSREVAEADRQLDDRQIAWIDALRAQGRLRTGFATGFLTAGDSREPELAGVWGAVVGSFLTLLVTLAVALPLGVAAAIYLEEFAPPGRFTELIEVNINNLAAVPSIVFGLLGLAVFLNFFHLPRSAPLVGGLTLALMTLPTIIIAGRASMRAVPPSIREAARGLGASPLQVVGHHVLPLALPGILTGTIIGTARALGETAPLLMIGMVAFIVDIPRGFTDAATALPVQVYLWADSPERAFVEKTSGAILVLLAFLIAMNATAVVLRRRFEKRW